MANFKAIIRFNQQNLGQAVNVFTFDMTPVFTDAQLLASAANWIAAIYSPLRNYMDTGCVFASGQVLEVDDAGDTIRIVGGIAPAVSGLNATEQTQLTSAFTGTARTAVPGVRGSKRFAGMSEIASIEGLLSNAALSALATAVANWLVGPIPPVGSGGARAGVISSAVAGFVPFTNSGIATNIPGTQVTRKPGRGS